MTTGPFYAEEIKDEDGDSIEEEGTASIDAFDYPWQVVTDDPNIDDAYICNSKEAAERLVALLNAAASNN